MSKYSTRFQVLLFVFVCLVVGYSYMVRASGDRTMKLDLSGSGYSEFVDFLYEFSARNRLNVQWFGWYRVSEVTRWFERSDRETNFKVKIYLLTEENGYMFFDNGFDEKSVNYIADNGDGKEVWLTVLSDFEKEIESRGWAVH